jgi:hypothetical protein
VEGNH